MSHKEAKKLRQLHRKSAQAAAEQAHNETREMMLQRIQNVDKRVEQTVFDMFERRMKPKPKFFPKWLWTAFKSVFVASEKPSETGELVVPKDVEFRVNGTDSVKKYDRNKVT